MDEIEHKLMRQTMWNKILQHCLTALITGSIVFAFTMTSVVRQVSAQGITIQFMQETQQAMTKRIEENESKSLARDDKLSASMEKLIEQNNLLIAAIRVEIQGKGRP